MPSAYHMSKSLATFLGVYKTCSCCGKYFLDLPFKGVKIIWKMLKMVGQDWLKELFEKESAHFLIRGKLWSGVFPFAVAWRLVFQQVCCEVAIHEMMLLHMSCDTWRSRRGTERHDLVELARVYCFWEGKGLPFWFSTISQGKSEGKGRGELKGKGNGAVDLSIQKYIYVHYWSTTYCNRFHCSPRWIKVSVCFPCGSNMSSL